MSYDRISNEIASTIGSQEEHINRINNHRKRMNAEKVTSKDTSDTNNFQTNPDRDVNRKETVSRTSILSKKMFSPVFEWEIKTERNKDKKYVIKPTEKNVQFNSLFDTSSSSSHILSILGYPIDISQQVDSYKQLLQRNFIQSKSHNELISRFSELKYGIIGALLSLLGVDSSEIKKLKKEALNKAIQDNIESFEQNEYNYELLTIFSNTKKDKSRKKVLTKLGKQLVAQMKNLGQPDYYTKDIVYDIKKKQINKILIDLLEEKQNLTFLRNYR